MGLSNFGVQTGKYVGAALLRSIGGVEPPMFVNIELLVLIRSLQRGLGGVGVITSERGCRGVGVITSERGLGVLVDHRTVVVGRDVPRPSWLRRLDECRLEECTAVMEGST